MMRILVFLVLLMGIFGVFLAQYLGQYREAYRLWVSYVVYDKNIQEDCKSKKDICSQIESYSRELCGLTNIISILFYAICFTFLLVLIVIRLNMPVPIESKSEYNIYVASGILTCVSFIGLPLVLHYSNIDIKTPMKTSRIDEDLFAVWHKLKCHECKQKDFKEKLEPYRLYEIWAEKINNRELVCSAEERKILGALLHDKNLNSRP